MPGTPAGCPWDTRPGQTVVYQPVSQRFLVIFTIEKLTEKAISAGTPAGCPRDNRPSRGFSENLCDFFLCAFSATVAATPPCSATPFQTTKFRCDTSQHRGGGRCDTKILRGCSATPVLHLQNAIKSRKSAATRVARHV